MCCVLMHIGVFLFKNGNVQFLMALISLTILCPSPFLAMNGDKNKKKIKKQIDVRSRPCGSVSETPCRHLKISDFK